MYEENNKRTKDRSHHVVSRRVNEKILICRIRFEKVRNTRSDLLKGAEVKGIRRGPNLK